LPGGTEKIHETPARIAGSVSPKCETGNLATPPLRSVKYFLETEFYEVQSKFVNGFRSWKTNESLWESDVLATRHGPSVKLLSVGESDHFYRGFRGFRGPSRPRCPTAAAKPAHPEVVPPQLPDDQIALVRARK
jgi:hypothetical protein